MKCTPHFQRASSLRDNDLRSPVSCNTSFAVCWMTGSLNPPAPFFFFSIFEPFSLSLHRSDARSRSWYWYYIRHALSLVIPGTKMFRYVLWCMLLELTGLKPFHQHDIFTSDVLHDDDDDELAILQRVRSDTVMTSESKGRHRSVSRCPRKLSAPPRAGFSVSPTRSPQWLTLVNLFVYAQFTSFTSDSFWWSHTQKVLCTLRIVPRHDPG